MSPLDAGLSSSHTSANGLLLGLPTFRGLAHADYVTGVLALLLVALSVGMDNFGASTALGVSGVDRTLRLQVAVIFGVFEAVVPVFGLLLGHSLSQGLGAASNPIAGAVLGVAGSYVVFSELVGQKNELVGQTTAAPSPGPGITHLILLAAALRVHHRIMRAM